MPITKVLKKEVLDGYRSLNPTRSELHKEMFDTNVINLIDDDEENDYSEVKKEDIVAKESVWFSTEEIDINFGVHDIKRLVVRKIEEMCQLSYDYLSEKREEILNHGRVSVLPSSIRWNSAEKYSDAIANWVEVSNDTLEKLSPVSDEEKKFNVDGVIYVEEQEEGVEEEK